METMNNNNNERMETAIDTMIELGIVTEEELSLVTQINGYNIDTINDIIYVRTKYINIEQFLGD